MPLGVKMDIKSLIRNIPDFPKPGIIYRDITTLLQNPEGLNYVIDHFSDEYANLNIDYVIGIESRGFIFGAPIAYKLNAGFVPVRKPLSGFASFAQNQTDRMSAGWT